MSIEATIRLSAFVLFFVLLSALERLYPRRSAASLPGTRWWTNLGLVTVNSLVLRLFFPAAAVGVALYAEQQGIGLLNRPDLRAVVPLWVSIPLVVIAMDLLIWAQHLASHKIPLLWRLHRVHHSDLHLDASTGVRFHPVEILLSMLLKAGFILLTGAPAVAVLLFEVLLNATSMFNHANWRLRLSTDRWLRRVVVTPDMHRVHHSWSRHETDSNYGFNLPWWDHLFGTYRAQPEQGHLSMTLGLSQFRESQQQRVDQLLLQPIRHL